MNEKLPRILSKNELLYLEELELFKKVLEFTTLISINQGGIETTPRGVRSIKIFTRQTITALSLNNILPNPKVTTSSEIELWDVSSIASLARNIMEGYLSLQYFGIEKISESEEDLRFLILQLHRNIEWFNIRGIDEHHPEYTEFKIGIEQQKRKIKNHPYLNKLATHNKNKALQFVEMYKTKPDFEIEFIVCKNLRNMYRLLSNFVHPLPLSIERTDNIKGRGIGNEADISYCIHSLMVSRRFLAASVVGVVDYFPNSLGLKFSKELETIRPLQFVGFENNE